MGMGRGRHVLDEGGVQLAHLMVVVGTSLKELLDQGRFLLLQLGDALTFVSHLLGEKPILLLQHVDGLLGACRGWGCHRDQPAWGRGGVCCLASSGKKVTQAAVHLLQLGDQAPQVALATFREISTASLLSQEPLVLLHELDVLVVPLSSPVYKLQALQ